MIGKVIPKHKSKGSSLSLLNDYVLARGGRGNKEHKVICFGTLGIVGGIDTANEEMAAVAAQNRRCKNPVMHCLLSWREGESQSSEQVREAVEIALEELGLSGQQCVYALHGNTGNMHVHISVSRIDLMTHKAIDAAGGFTQKAMERAARRIEYTQGWAVEQNAWSRYDADKISVELPKTRPETHDRDIPQTVKDIENLTGEKSALRIASEKLKGLEFSSWEELHEKLAELGMEYRKKGSGAVIFVGETPIKASAAGKRFGLNLLEKKLGEYREHGGDVEKKELAPEPLTSKNDNGTWREYAAFKAEFIKNSGIVRKAMWAKIREERAALKQAQKAERDKKINSFSWVGRCSEMNALRSQIAAKHAGERLDQKERHDEMKRKLKELYPPLPTFEEWMRDRGKDADAEAWRHRADHTAQSILIAPGEGAEPTGKEVKDIRGFKSKATDKGTMFYNPRTGANAFRDSGKLIRIYDRDEATMLASMQLGMAKWGSIRIAGSDGYKARCVELAVEHGIKITNPELRPLYQQKLADYRAAERATDGKLVKIDRARADFAAYHEAIGADRYKVTATKIRPDGSKQGFMVNRKDGAPDGFSPDELDKKMRRLVSLEANDGRNIYYTPISDDKHHILIDDLTNERLADLITDGYEPNAILETSPGNWQAVFTIPKLGTKIDREVGNELVARLNKEYGDPKVSGEIHAHRAPGFENRKPKHERDDGTFSEVRLVRTRKGSCAKLMELAQEVCAEIIERQREAEAKADAARASLPKELADKNAVKAYELQCRDVIRIQKRTAPDVLPDFSRVDCMAAVRLRATGYTREATEEAIRSMSPKLREAHGIGGTHDWTDYARRTANYAYGMQGDGQLAKLTKYVEYWKKIDRDALAMRSAKPSIVPSSSSHRSRGVDIDR